MGFTIEDMLVVSSDRYKMKLEAGRAGWSNSISWLLMLEEMTIISNLSGKELAVTTGLGFQTEEAMEALVQSLMDHSASGLIVNTGCYIKEIPESVLKICDENGFPLLTVPWEIYLADMIKDLTIRVFLQSTTDEQISGAMIRAIERPQERESYSRDLLPFYDLDGTFQVAVITTGDLDRMDTVERKRIAYRMQLYLTNLTHNGHFFYYAGYFVIVMNAVEERESEEILEAFAGRIGKKMPDRNVRIGVSGQVLDIANLHVAYRRAKAAAEMAWNEGKGMQYFDRMGIYRLLYSVEDKALLRDLSDKPLQPLLDYDREHGSDYLETLSCFLRCGGSIKAMSEEMFIHRNTILYRMANIRKMLGCQLETPQERLVYMIACMIREMNRD